MATKGSTDRALAEIEAEELRLRLAALEADLASSRKERLSKAELAAQYCVDGPRDAGLPPAPGTLTAKIQDAQNKARRRRLRAVEKQAKAHEEQLERVRPELEQLQARAAHLRAQLEDLELRHGIAVRKLNAEIAQTSGKIERLQAPPALEVEPNPDAVEMAISYRDPTGRPHFAPRAVVEATREAQRRGLSGADVTRHLIDAGLIEVGDV